MDLVSRGFYDSMDIQRADGFVVQTGKPKDVRTVNILFFFLGGWGEGVSFLDNKGLVVALPLNGQEQLLLPAAGLLRFLVYTLSSLPQSSPEAA